MCEIKSYYDFVRPYYHGRDAGHDFHHIARIFDRLEELSVGCVPEPEFHKLYFIAAFHGLVKRLGTDICFQNQVNNFLRQLGWENGDISEAFAALERHLFAPQTTEEMIVHDANFFEVTGRFGIAKAFTVGGSFNQTYERTLEIFEANLDKLVFRTPIGRSTYEARKDYARAFIEELRAEIKSRQLNAEISSR